MATVLLAEDLKHHRQVAVKVLDPEVAAAIGPERFLREIQTVAGLTHPHILPLHDSGEADGLLYYVMPYAEGRTLRDRLAREKQLPLDEALRITREVADALGHAHAHGVVHRDIKPENILLESGYAVVADFGIARAAAVAGDKAFTATGVALGTPAYMSPEQVAGGAADARSDLYSLGCMLYEMLAGQAPFTGPTAESVVFQHLNAARPSVTAMRPGVPAAVDQVITRAMARAPVDRFAGTREFITALTAATGAVAVPTPPGVTMMPGEQVAVVAAARQSLRQPLVAAGVAALFITGLAAVAAWQSWWPFSPASGPSYAKRDWILVADFQGPSGDSTLAVAVQSLLSAALDQSEIVQVVPPDQVQVALKAAGKPKGTRVDTELARELAYRRSVRAVLEGTVGRLGKGYSIVLRIVDVDSARVLLTQSGTARDDDDLILTVDQMARKLRQGLGENRQGLKATRPMILVATPSFEAYRLLVESRIRYNVRSSDQERLRYMRAAVALDPGFAAAWAVMATNYWNIGYPDSARMCWEEVLRHPDRAGPKVLHGVTLRLLELDGNDAVILAELDRMLAEDPDNRDALSFGPDILWRAGRFEDALDRARRLKKLMLFAPVDGYWVNETLSLVLLGRFDEAREATRQQSGVWKLPLRAFIELTDGRFAVAESIAIRHRDDPSLGQNLTDGMRSHLAEARFGRGDLVGAATVLREGAEICRRAHDTLGLDWYRAFSMDIRALTGDAFPVPSAPAGPDTTVRALLSLGYEAVLAGDTLLARRCLRALRGRPAVERVGGECLPIVLEARLEAMGGRPQEAVRLLRPVVTRVPQEDQEVTTAVIRWWLADAYIQLGQPDSAAAALERGGAISYPNPRNRVELPFVHHRLALLYASLGRVDDAERHLKAAEHDWDRPDALVRRKLDEARAAIQMARGLSRPQG